MKTPFEKCVAIALTILSDIERPDSSEMRSAASKAVEVMQHFAASDIEVSVYDVRMELHRRLV